MSDHLRIRARAVTLGIGMLLTVAAGTARADQPPLLSPAGFPSIDGQPRLVIGMYENPGMDPLLDEAIAAGFNLFPCRADRKPRPRLWQDMLAIARELRAPQPAILAPEVSPPSAYEAEENSSSHDGAGLRLMLRKVGQDYVLIVVNERPSGLAFRIRQLPAALEGKTLLRLGGDESVQVTQGGFRDGIESYGAHVYATSKVFAPPPGQ